MWERADARSVEKEKQTGRYLKIPAGSKVELRYESQSFVSTGSRVARVKRGSQPLALFRSGGSSWSTSSEAI